MIAAVGRLEESRLRTAAPKLIGVAVDLPHRGVENVWVRRVEQQIDRAGLRALEENLLPIAAAVSASKNTALVVSAGRIAECGDIDEVRVLGMDANARDGACRGESHVLPARARVRGSVHAVALHDVPAKLHFTHTHIDDVRMRRRDGYGADGGTIYLTVGHGPPAHATIRGLPEPATGGAKVILERPARA